MAVAALGLSACTGEKLVPDTGNADGKFVTVHFGAEAAIEGATKATLTTDDELTFKSAWENGDVLSVEYSNDNTPVNKGIVPATWTADHFDATLPKHHGTWDYNVVYPTPDVDGAVNFGSARTQKGIAYNSNYDLMKGSAIVENADAGKTADGKDIVFNMTRQTAIAYFHLTSTLDEEVVSAKLSVEGGNIASSSVKVSGTDYSKGFDLSVADLNEITITYDAGTAPMASDFQLWYNVLPTTYTKMTLTVETANHTLTISRTAADNYAAGKLYKVVKDIPAEKWVKKVTNNNYVLHEGELVEGDYLIIYKGKAMKAAVTDKDRLNYADVAVKGTRIENSDESIIWHIAPSAEYWTIFNGNTKSFAASNGTKNQAQLLADGTDDMSLWTVTKTKDASTFEFVNKANTTAKVNANLRNNDIYGFACYSDKIGGPLSLYRLDGPVDNTIPSLSVDQTSKVWAADATDAFVVKVTVNSEGGDWTVSPETLSWATIAVDKTAGTITVTPNGANTAQTANEATLTVAHASDASLKAEISLKQNGKGSAAASYFVKVTTAPTDWSGKYLIVFDKKARSYVAAKGKDLISKNTNELSIIGDKIESNETVDVDMVEISKTTDGYKILLSDGKYLSVPASNACGSNTTGSVFTITLGKNGVSISGVDSKNATRTLCNNGGYYRMYPSVGSYKLPQLYKLDN